MNMQNNMRCSSVLHKIFKCLMKILKKSLKRFKCFSFSLSSICFKVGDTTWRVTREHAANIFFALYLSFSIKKKFIRFILAAVAKSTSEKRENKMESDKSSSNLVFVENYSLWHRTIPSTCGKLYEATNCQKLLVIYLTARVWGRRVLKF